ncbi:hypothetical protein Taro_040236 [Colocasia esculenta]|uniref:Uncharacterized protein n=1 Tax=Colocasia esculenta TaxID=4460 RepID=A0A843WSF3_COLES|nr:hypothetical protein [Colocasia esculenta]
MIDVVADAGPSFKTPSCHDMTYTGVALRERLRSFISGLKSFKHIWMERGYFLNPRVMCAGNAYVHGEMDAYRMRIGTYFDARLQYALRRVNPEGILDGDEPRDPEFKVPVKRLRASPSKGKQLEIVEDTEE